MTEPCAKPRSLASADGKLSAVAMIAVVYLIAWYEVSTTPPPAAVSVPATPRAVWIDQLPATERPMVVPPAGWRLASRDEQAATPPLVRAPASRPVRVRTRSS